MSNQPISIIIPVYNEEAVISSVLNQVTSQFPSAEIIVINDGSTDKTGEILSDYNIKIIHHVLNKGYGSSLKDGIKQASNENLLFMDGDGQHNVGDIHKLTKEIEKYDMVVGARTAKSHQPFFRRPGKLILKYLSQVLSGCKILDLNSGFRAIKKSVIEKYLHLLPQGFSASTTMTLIMLTRGYSVKYVPIETKKRKGKSTVNPIKDGFEAIIIMLRMINLINPLRIFIPTAIILFTLGVLWGLPYLIGRKGLTVASLFLMLTGCLIFFMGMIADQISQMRLEKYE